MRALLRRRSVERDPFGRVLQTRLEPTWRPTETEATPFGWVLDAVKRDALIVRLYEGDEPIGEALWRPTSVKGDGVEGELQGPLDIAVDPGKVIDGVRWLDGAHAWHQAVKRETVTASAGYRLDSWGWGE